MNELIEYIQTENLVEDVCSLIDSAQHLAYRSVDMVLVLRNWLLGKRISEEELKGESRATYGAEIVKGLSQVLTEKYGRGFSKRTLYKCQQFYKTFTEIVPTLSAQLDANRVS